VGDALVQEPRPESPARQHGLEQVTHRRLDQHDVLGLERAQLAPQPVLRAARDRRLPGLTLAHAVDRAFRRVDQPQPAILELGEQRALAGRARTECLA
jgi:hypothetical protein